MSVDGKEFIRPEVVENEERQAEHAGQEQGLILPSRYLPDWVYLIPAESKPVMPGMVFPVTVGPGTVADTLRHVDEEVPERVVGFVLTKKGSGTGDRETADANSVQREFYRIGTVTRLLKFQQDNDGSAQALMQGVSRFQILKATQRDGRFLAQVVYLEETEDESQETKALALSIMNTMRELVKHNPLFSEEIRMFISRNNWNEPGRLADFAVTMTSSEREEIQEVLECLDVKARMEKVLFLLRKELDINQLKEKITQQIEEKISKQQREFFLREQLKAIKQELGLEKDEKQEEIDRYEERIQALDLGDEADRRMREELDKLKILSPQSPEYSVTRNYLDWLTALPWGVYTRDRLDVKRVRRVLDRDHYGLEDVKERILEFIGEARLRGSVEGSILCLIGPPGVGKTSLGRAVADALGRKFYRFSLGGMRDEAEIKGHRRTYIGAMPGKVMQAIHTVETANPVIMLDEIDKVGASFQGDPASALLEVLDPEQNSAFRDHYLDVPFDLSRVLFIATANVPDTIPGPLLDRMEEIHLSGYILDEKMSIANRHLIPKLLTETGLSKADVRITRGALRRLVDGYAREAGVRALEKSIRSCMRKVAKKRASGDLAETLRIDVQQVEALLGKPRFSDDPLMRQGRPGVVMGLAWTPMGGSTLYVEAVTLAGGKADFKLTGQLGEVMTESCHIAYSLVTGNAAEFGLSGEVFADKATHIHVPAGAIKKDGPSAGITMATALVSLGRNETPPPGWAMTGELTLSGRVLPVGGIKEKVIAAKRSRVQHVILPVDNQTDFEEIPEKVRSGLTPHYVATYAQVFDLLFGG